MRIPSAFRLLATALSFIATLSSPAMALAHGEAHEHQAASHPAGPHGWEAGNHAPVGESAAAAQDDDDHAELHARLHADCRTRAVHAYGVAVLPTSLAAIPAVAVSRVPVAILARTVFEPRGRAAPPDQPRAPPVD
jgi:hypothetical protein